MPTLSQIQKITDSIDKISCIVGGENTVSVIFQNLSINSYAASLKQVEEEIGPYSFQSFLKSYFIFILYIFFHTVSGQISHGGKPLSLHTVMEARSLTPAMNLFVEMPSFNIQAALRQSQQGQANLKSLEFAHKFYPFLRPDNSGISFIKDNMKVWCVGIRSEGAHSLNILFTKFRLPPGAQLFVYNSDQSEILGSYTEKNNTEINILPVQPIGGEELIVEYQEPLEAAFKGEIEVGEVNHDFLGIFKGNQPGVDPIGDCHPNLICYPENIQPGRGIVVLIINGITACTGALVNNTNEDGTPYLLTATHCLNGNYNASFLANRKYDIVAGSIVVFFNFNSPLCDIDIRGPLQMTLVSADSILISERHDISLLRLKDTPPEEYQPYYLGWNATGPSSPIGPFHGIHHPQGNIKKVAIDEDRLSLSTFDLPYYLQEEPNSWWKIGGWDTGVTDYGSSGSPLLDREKRVIGTLTGGISQCSSPKGPDSYASLFKLWEVEESLDNPNPISYYLDPGDTKTRQLGGYNPYKEQPYTKSHNFNLNDKAEKHLFQQIPLFSTNNSFGYTEFAEQFYVEGNTRLRGVFVSSPVVSNISNMNLRIKVYTGEVQPDQLVHEQSFNYSYKYFNNTFYPTAPRDMNYSVENYIQFNKELEVSGSFYISYYDANGIPSGFSTFNAEPRKIGTGLVSTAWMKNELGWIRSSENIEDPINTAFLIAPYVIGNTSTSVVTEKEHNKLVVYYSNKVKRIIIESNYELSEWEIFHSSGIKIHHEIIGISKYKDTYSSAHLVKGVYIVRVKSIAGTVSAKKILVI